MDKPTEKSSCKIEGACAGPRCPFARLLGTNRGRGLLALLVALGATHYFAPEPVSSIAFVTMWVLAIGLSAWVLWSPQVRPTAADKAS
jgi:hypothetical protein